MLEKCREATDLGLGIAVSVENSGESTRNEVLSDTILAESAPLDVSKKNVAHRMEERSYADGKLFVEVRLSTALIQSGNMRIQPSPGTLF